MNTVSIRRLVVLMAAVAAPGWADAVVKTSLDVSLQIDPSSGKVIYSSPTSASVFAQALDGLGGDNQTFNNMGALTMAATTLDSGSASSNGASPLGSAVGANILIPGLSLPCSPHSGQAPIAHWFMRQVNMHLACSQFHIHRLHVPRIFDSQISRAL